jgi:uncharacterized protein
MSDLAPLVKYSTGGRLCEVTIVKVVMAALIAFFALWDLSPRSEKLMFNPKYVPFGGALSGFFGGLSGLQGALRSAFLIRCGLSKNAFIATGVVSTVAVDTTRLLVYGTTFFARNSAVLASYEGAGLIVAGILAAFAGSFIDARFVKKITMKAVQIVVAIMLLMLAIALGLGFI